MSSPGCLLARLEVLEGVRLYITSVMSTVIPSSIAAEWAQCTATSWLCSNACEIWPECPNELCVPADVALNSHTSPRQPQILCRFCFDLLVFSPWVWKAARGDDYVNGRPFRRPVYSFDKFSDSWLLWTMSVLHLWAADVDILKQVRSSGTRSKIFFGML